MAISKSLFPCHSAVFGISLIVMCSSVMTEYLPQDKRNWNNHNQLETNLLYPNEIDLIEEVCSFDQSFERLDEALDLNLQTIEVHPNTWIFVTKCKYPGRSCKGYSEPDLSFCRPKKSWIQVYGRIRDSEGEWRPHWVAADTACVCSIRKIIKPPFDHLLGQK